MFDNFKSFEGFFPQILLGPFLNSLAHLKMSLKESDFQSRSIFQ